MKSKIVSFRLSEAEYAAVEQMSQKQRCGSVALFARAATLVGACGGLEVTSGDMDAAKLWRSLEAITAALESLAATLHLVLQTLHESRSSVPGTVETEVPCAHGCPASIPG